eukprot:5451171-Amphidinium_carterae.2
MDRAVVPVFRCVKRGLPPFLSAVAGGEGPAVQLAACVIVELTLESDQGEDKGMPCMRASVPRATFAEKSADGSRHAKLPLVLFGLVCRPEVVCGAGRAVQPVACSRRLVAQAL